MNSPSFRIAVALAVGLAVHPSAFLHAELTNGQPALSVLGKPDFSSTSPNGPAADAIGLVEGVAIDPITDKVFVADMANHRILRFGVSAAYRTGGTAEAVFGQADFTSGAANRGGSASANTLDTPRSIFVDSAGSLWVADSVNHRVLRFDRASSKASGSDADGVLGQVDFVSTTSATTGNGMNSPVGVTSDSSGNLFVTDRANHRVLIFYNASAKGNGANADRVLGQADFVTSASGTTSSSFNNPWGVCTDHAENLWVCDSSNNRVLRFANAASIESGVAASAVLGQTDFDSSVALPVGGSALNSPYYVAAAPNGTLWVGDFGYERYLGFRNAARKANGDPADIVLGQKKFGTQGAGSPSATGVNGANGVAVDREGGLFATDFSFRRVLRFSGSVRVKAPAKVNASRGKAIIHGKSAHASLVRIKQPGKPFVGTVGTVGEWQVKVKGLTRRITRVRVEALAFDGRNSTRIVRVLDR